MDLTLKSKFQSSILGKPVRVELSDGRKIYGNLQCIDKNKNMVLIDALEEVASEYVAPINDYLTFFVKNDYKLEKYLKIDEKIKSDEEGLKKLDTLFRKGKFLIGQVIIPGREIVKLETQQDL